MSTERISLRAFATDAEPEDLGYHRAHIPWMVETATMGDLVTGAADTAALGLLAELRDGLAGQQQDVSLAFFNELREAIRAEIDRRLDRGR